MSIPPTGETLHVVGRYRTIDRARRLGGALIRARGSEQARSI